MIIEVNVHAGKEKLKRNNLSDTFGFLRPPSFLSFSLSQTHTLAHLHALSDAFFFSMEAMRREQVWCFLEAHQGKDMLALYYSPIAAFGFEWSEEMHILAYSFVKVTVNWFEHLLSSWWAGLSFGKMHISMTVNSLLLISEIEALTWQMKELLLYQRHLSFAVGRSSSWISHTAARSVVTEEEICLIILTAEDESLTLKNFDGVLPFALFLLLCVSLVVRI